MIMTMTGVRVNAERIYNIDVVGKQDDITTQT